MLSVANKPIVLSVIMLSVVMLNVVMLSVVAPIGWYLNFLTFSYNYFTDRMCYYHGYHKLTFKEPTCFVITSPRFCHWQPLLH